MSYHEEQKKKERERADWFSGLRVGDEWQATTYRTGCSKSMMVVSIRIESESKTQFGILYKVGEFVRGARFRKADGFVINSRTHGDISDFCLIKGPATKEALLQATADELRTNVGKALSGTGLSLLGLNTLIAVAVAVGVPVPAELADAVQPKAGDSSPD